MRLIVICLVAPTVFTLIVAGAVFLGLMLGEAVMLAGR
jgi:hypothetical protein